MFFVTSFKQYFLLFFHLLQGIWKISQLHQAPISILGGPRMLLETLTAQQLQRLTHMLIDTHIPVLMEIGTENIRIYTTTKNNTSPAPYKFLTMKYFFARKWLLINYSIGFVIFPGGLSTLDEFAEIITLIKTKKLAHVPVILIGTHYWDPLIKWLHTSPLSYQLILLEDNKLFTVTNSLDETHAILASRCTKKAPIA